jgi:hypothetical protein
MSSVYPEKPRPGPDDRAGLCREMRGSDLAIAAFPIVIVAVAVVVGALVVVVLVRRRPKVP